MDVVINHEQELFVVSAGKGYSTLGFEHVFKQLKQLVARLNLSIQIREDEKGTIGQYADFQRAINEAAKANLKETWFNLDTPVKVRRILEQYRKSGKAIRLFYGDVERGEDWLEENDVVGKIGRSSGTFKIPILLQNGESWGDKAGIAADGEHRPADGCGRSEGSLGAPEISGASVADCREARWRRPLFGVCRRRSSRKLQNFGEGSPVGGVHGR